jgi:predicted protein tyrosine phosphatase
MESQHNQDDMKTLRQKAIPLEQITGGIARILQGSEQLAPLYLASRGSAANSDTFDVQKDYRILAIANISEEVPFYFSEEEEKELTGGQIVDKLRISVKDSADEKLIQKFPEVLEFIHHARSVHKPVLVHCSMGVSRSPAVVIAYLIKYEEMTLYDAYYHVLSARSIVCPNLGFMQQLGNWEEKCRGSTTLFDLPVFKTKAAEPMNASKIVHVPRDKSKEEDSKCLIN